MSETKQSYTPEELEEIKRFRAHLLTIQGSRLTQMNSRVTTISWFTPLAEISVEFTSNCVEIFLRSLEITDFFCPNENLTPISRSISRWRAEMTSHSDELEPDFRARMILTAIFAYPP